jgi:hypothetical protein
MNLKEFKQTTELNKEDNAKYRNPEKNQVEILEMKSSIT